MTDDDTGASRDGATSDGDGFIRFALIVFIDDGQATAEQTTAQVNIVCHLLDTITDGIGDRLSSVRPIGIG